MYGVCHELQLLQKHRAACSPSLKIPHYKKKKRRKKKGGGVFIKFAPHRQAACFSFILSCVLLRPLFSPPASYFLTHAHTPSTAGQLARWLQADYYMHLWNIQMAACPTVHYECHTKTKRKKRKGGGVGDRDGQTENNNEGRSYLLSELSSLMTEKSLSSITL